MRGPIADVSAALQPVAHSLLQSVEEVRATLPTLTLEEIWSRPKGIASVGYHVRHAMGSIDRLFTYARGEQLSDEQFGVLVAEADPTERPREGAELVEAFEGAVERALVQLRATREESLRDVRGVGRAKLPSTVLGLLFHAAEHTQRHVGQMVTTAKVVRA
jgi:uncharacterized damage-inducible protein DinB